MKLAISPIFSEKTRDYNVFKEVLKGPRVIDHKIKGLVLTLITGSRGALFPSVSAQQVICLISGNESFRRMELKKRGAKKKRLQKNPFLRSIPIGLEEIEPDGWLNALMQFLYFIPTLAEMFSFAPKSFQPVQDFFDQYAEDLEEGVPLSRANTPKLFRFFKFAFPDFSIVDLFETLIQSIQPKWQIYKSFSELIQRAPQKHLFLHSNFLKKQVFAKTEYIYDLGAFIEMRPDEARVNYIAYVKVKGAWYQCDNERIMSLRSDSLKSALQRGVLAYYTLLF